MTIAVKDGMGGSANVWSCDGDVDDFDEEVYVVVENGWDESEKDDYGFGDGDLRRQRGGVQRGEDGEVKSDEVAEGGVGEE